MSLQAACNTTSDWSIDISSHSLDKHGRKVSANINCGVLSRFLNNYKVRAF